MQKIIEGWGQRESETFRKGILKAKHSLHKHPLFTDEALVRLMEIHPDEKSFYMATGDDPSLTGVHVWRSGDVSRLTGEQRLEAVKAGKLWVHLRMAMAEHPEYKGLLDQMYDELEELNPGYKPFKKMGGLLISSPTAHCPYHIDRTDTILWHIRGVKRIYVYPIDEETLPDTACETMFRTEADDLENFQESWNERAAIFDLHPGEFACWPIHAPHRVLNQQGLNVSITTEYTTWDAVALNGAIYTTGFLREKGVFKGSPRSLSVPVKWAAFGASRVLRAIERPERHVDRTGKEGERFIVEPPKSASTLTESTA